MKKNLIGLLAVAILMGGGIALGVAFTSNNLALLFGACAAETLGLALLLGLRTESQDSRSDNSAS